jgi:hypothetical protein
VNVIVYHGRKQIVGRPDRVKIAGEVQVDIGHRHDLRAAAAGGAALHTETGAQAGFAQADQGFLAEGAQPVAKTDRGRRFALPRRGRRYGRYKDQLAIRPRDSLSSSVILQCLRLRVRATTEWTNYTDFLRQALLQMRGVGNMGSDG